MPVQLDIAGNFGKGQQVRQNRQIEKALDYELDDLSKGRLGQHRERMNQREKPLFGEGTPGEELDDLAHGGEGFLVSFFRKMAKKREDRVSPGNMQGEQNLNEMAAEAQKGGAAAIAGSPGMTEEQAYSPAKQTEQSAYGYNDGGRIGGAGPPAVQVPSTVGIPEPIPRQGFSGPQFRHGGKVQRAIAYADGGRAGYDMKKRRERYGIIPGEYDDSAATEAGLAIEGAFPKTREAVVRGGANLTTDLRNLDEADTDYETGSALRNVVGGRLVGAGEKAVAVAQDVLGKPGRMIAGALGFDGSAGKPAAVPEKVKEKVEESPHTVELGKAAITQGVEQAAVAKREAAPPGKINYADEPDVTLADIPTMTTRNWVDYRKSQVDALMLQGASAKDAHASVTEEQQQVVQDYMAQASMHLAIGDTRATILALHTAYQHFPNGKTVKFGTQMGKDGQMHVVSQTFKEGTEDPIGVPKLITEQGLSAARTNFEDPSKFLQWTTDHQDAVFKQREYLEVTKPAAEATAQYQDRLGRAALTRADADAFEATNPLAAGLKPGEIRQGSEFFNKLIA